MNSVIHTQQLHKEFGEKVAVADLTLQVEPGEIFGFLGPNGAGKTTSVKMLLGLTSPTAGEATLLGQPLGDRLTRARVGFLPEHFRFHEWLQAAEFLDLHSYRNIDRWATEVGARKGIQRGIRVNREGEGYTKDRHSAADIDAVM